MKMKLTYKRNWMLIYTMAWPGNIMLDIIMEDVHATLALPIEEKVEARKNRDIESRDNAWPDNRMLPITEEDPWHTSHKTDTPNSLKCGGECGILKEQGHKSGDDGLTNSMKRRLRRRIQKRLRSKEKQGPMVSHSKHQTTDVVEQRNNLTRGIGKHGIRKACARRAFCINSWPSASPSTTMARIILEITKEDVCATLALAMGPLEVHVASTYKLKNKYTRLLELWRRWWNLGRAGTPKVGMMVE
ncbi:hypothetical protein Cgig2_002769 [Carnegiea gigantea]|uniref:Uncharacterized protein n=1 Tax=Carnegiea gigantea TaxID=171969 RepID=A0A9Q1GZQ5_9CARY|nr:hypothetical protein Cgig2_002769 [Carnegiea gigantea]